MTIATRIAVTRVGTQVVVRLRGTFGDADAAELHGAMRDIEALASRLVALDLTETLMVDGAALDFIAELKRRWTVRQLNTPHHLRERFRDPASPLRRRV